MAKKIVYKRLAMATAMVSALSVVVGSLAFFSDHITGNNGSGVTTNTEAVDIITDPDPIRDPSDPSNPKDFEDDLTGKWAFINAKAYLNFNPGDQVNLSYTLKNDSTVAIDTRETIVIDSTVPMTYGSEEFDLFIATSEKTITGNTSCFTGTTAPAYETRELIRDGSNNITGIKYVIKNEGIAAGASVQKDYFVVFNKLASNKFQGAVCNINYLVEAQQENGGDWTVVKTENITLGSQTVTSVVDSVEDVAP